MAIFVYLISLAFPKIVVSPFIATDNLVAIQKTLRFNLHQASLKKYSCRRSHPSRELYTFEITNAPRHAYYHPKHGNVAKWRSATPFYTLKQMEGDVELGTAYEMLRGLVMEEDICEASEIIFRQGVPEMSSFRHQQVVTLLAGVTSRIRERAHLPADKRAQPNYPTASNFGDVSGVDFPTHMPYFTWWNAILPPAATSPTPLRGGNEESSDDEDVLHIVE